MKFLKKLADYFLISLIFIGAIREIIHDKHGESWANFYSACLGVCFGILLVILFWFFHKLFLILLLVILFGFMLKLALMVKPLLPEIFDVTKKEIKKFMENSNEP